MPIVPAGRRSATAALAQSCVCDLNLGIDLRGSRQIPAATAGQSCAATPSTNAFNGVDCHNPPRLPGPNPHSARGTTACHFPRFPSLEAFGRRPQPRRSRHRPSAAGIRNPSHYRNRSRPTSRKMHHQPGAPLRPRSKPSIARVSRGWCKTCMLRARTIKHSCMPAWAWVTISSIPTKQGFRVGYAPT